MIWNSRKRIWQYIIVSTLKNDWGNLAEFFGKRSKLKNTNDEWRQSRSLQWWPNEILRQKRFLLCINNHWKYENKQYTIEKPYKIATRNAKKNFEFFKICWFLGPFLKNQFFWENGSGRHQMGTMLIHYTSIFNESQCGSPPESFIQKCWLVSNLPIFQNWRFFEKGPKNQQILKNSKFFFAFLVAIL